jgi:hypothetical protein
MKIIHMLVAKFATEIDVRAVENPNDVSEILGEV